MNSSKKKSAVGLATMGGYELNPGAHVIQKLRMGWWLRVASLFDEALDLIAPTPWVGHAGLSNAQRMHTMIASARSSRVAPVRRPLYSRDERERRDASPWTLVQAFLAPAQFIAFAVSLVLVIRYMVTGDGYEIATVSILVKTLFLYVIMVTGSIWEKQVFGKWLFARSFFWEDMFSMVVLILQTTYIVCVVTGWASPRQQMVIAMAAYLTYVINAGQFLIKLRAARAEGAGALEHGFERRGQKV